MEKTTINIPQKYFEVKHDRILPSLVGLSLAEVRGLNFWHDVKISKCGFNQLETCALKYEFGGENGSN